MRHGADTLLGDYERNVFRSDEQANPNICEHEKRWETRGGINSISTPYEIPICVSYSCELCACPYPQRSCKVKQP